MGRTSTPVWHDLRSAQLAYLDPHIYTWFVWLSWLALVLKLRLGDDAPNTALEASKSERALQKLAERDRSPSAMWLGH
jgi:hypothetical protein